MRYPSFVFIQDKREYSLLSSPTEILRSHWSLEDDSTDWGLLIRSAPHPSAPLTPSAQDVPLEEGFYMCHYPYKSIPALLIHRKRSPFPAGEGYARKLTSRFERHRGRGSPKMQAFSGVRGELGAKEKNPLSKKRIKVFERGYGGGLFCKSPPPYIILF